MVVFVLDFWTFKWPCFCINGKNMWCVVCQMMHAVMIPVTLASIILVNDRLDFAILFVLFCL